MSSAPKKKVELVLDGDVVAPRVKEQRYRIYKVKDGGAPILVATCRTRSAVGTTLCTLGAEGEFLDHVVGVLDGMDHKDDNGDWVGKWLILPWVPKPDDKNAAAMAAAEYSPEVVWMLKNPKKGEQDG